MSNFVTPTALSIIYINPKTNTIYLAYSGSNTVSVIDGKTNTVVKSIAVGVAPSAISINPGTHEIYVANSGSNTVSIINGTSSTLIKNIVVGGKTNDLAGQ